jgi:putative redox protein
MGTVIVRSSSGLRQEIAAGRHALVADEPVAAGGADAGPDPYALLLAALGACTAMTLKMYAARKGWPLADVTVELSHARGHAEDCAGCEDEAAKVDLVTRTVRVSGPLDAGQVARLAEIARRCPVHKTLTAGVRVTDSVTLEP